MNHDKAFAIYAVALVGAVFMLLSTSVFVGIASAPELSFMIKELVLGLAIRTAYKSFDGSNPFVDFLEYTGWKTVEGELGAPSDAMPHAA